MRSSAIRTIGITGGIGSGKSEVRRYLSRLGYPCADADSFAATLVASPETAAVIADMFGKSLILPDGQVDRAALRARVFSDPEARVQLEAYLHPRIQNAFEAWRQKFVEAKLPCVFWLFYEASLLVEKKRKVDFDRLILVRAPESERRARVRARGVADATFEAVVQAQASDNEKASSADYQIVNSGTLDDLRAETLHMLAWLSDEFSQS